MVFDVLPVTRTETSTAFAHVALRVSVPALGFAQSRGPEKTLPCAFRVAPAVLATARQTPAPPFGFCPSDACRTFAPALPVAPKSMCETLFDVVVLALYV